MDVATIAVATATGCGIAASWTVTWPSKEREEGDGKIAELFGVPVSKGEKTVTKSIDGVDVDLTRSATAKRWTFIIDRNGKVVHRDDRVNAKADPDSVEMFLKAVE